MDVRLLWLADKTAESDVSYLKDLPSHLLNGME